MVDATVREHERRWRETGAPEDQARWLVARLRAGELTRERLELAACLGSHAARAALDGQVRAWDAPSDAGSWLVALTAWGDEVLVRGLALAARALAAPEPRAAHDVLEAVLAWCDDPTSERGARAWHAARAALPAGAPPLSRLARDLARTLDGPRATRLELLTAVLASEPWELTAWLAFEARRLLREWALGLPDDRRASPPPLPTLDQLRRALRARFSRPPPREGLVDGPRGEPPPVAVARCVPFPSAAWLRRQRVLDVVAAGVDLLHVILPGARDHRGLLLLDGAGEVWPLDRRHPEHLDRLLAGEGDLPLDLDPADLAALVAEALLAGRNETARLVSGPGDLERPGYELDPAAEPDYRARLAPPALEREGEGWTLSFTCLSGWMHETQRLERVVARGRPRAPVRVERRTLCERVYARTPQIWY